MSDAGKFEEVATGLQFPEGPVALPDGSTLVVEIKRGTNPDGTARKATEAEVTQFHGYVRAVKNHYRKNTTPPIVRGLMIAQDYTAKGDDLREDLEKIPDPRMQFKTWERVIDESERMHLGWLAVSRRRAEGPSRAEFERGVRATQVSSATAGGAPAEDAKRKYNVLRTSQLRCLR